jgi:predicted homoserine dehydrogenase-like protein
MARSFALSVARHHPDFTIARILTRRPVAGVPDFGLRHALTDSSADLVDHADVIVECSGDVAHATEVSLVAFSAELPVVTLNAELHVTTGSQLARRGLITEAEGDQPGSLAALNEEAVQMGFRPLVYGNMKGFLNLNPQRPEMQYWAKRQGISVPNTTTATDGTKVQIEQALVANGLGATIAQPGLLGPTSDDLQRAAFDLASKAESIGQPLSDYVLANGWAPTGVFIVARHDDDMADLLGYFKLGKGPYYLLVKPYHLCSLEVMKTVRRMINTGQVLLNNSEQAYIGVAARAKRKLVPGECFSAEDMAFMSRGTAVVKTEYQNHVPLGILRGAVVRRPLEPEQVVEFDDVDLAETTACRMALEPTHSSSQQTRPRYLQGRASGQQPTANLGNEHAI